MTDEWENKFRAWKADKDRKKDEQTKLGEFEKEIVRGVEGIEKEVIEEVKGVVDYIKEPKHIRILKIIAIIIPLLLISYLFYSNFVVSKDFNYFYDLGGTQDAKKPYLTPLTRVSEITNGSEENYRNLTSDLVYFTASVPRGSSIIEIQTKFMDNFPNNSAVSLGAQDQEVWHYTYNPLFYSSLSELNPLYKLGNVYLINENLELLPLERLLQKENISIATDLPLKPTPNIIENYSGETIINTALRGEHRFYIYTSGNLSLEVKKQDINWYNNSDELNIYLYDSNESLIANTTIPDDGITGINTKQRATIQEGKLEVSNLSEGVYKLVFTDFDGLIREIKINTKKIVADRVFLADSSAYNTETKKSEVYIKTIKNSQLTLLTYHATGIQNISYNNKTFNFYQEDAPLYLNLTKGGYTFEIPKNDIILSYPGYFAFSQESYFEPFKQRVIKPEYSMEWLKNNADYFVSDYQSPVREGDWLISDVEFNIKQDNLFVSDNKLSLLFNVPHLSQEAYSNYTIPVDWINITVHKPSLIEQWVGR